MKIRNFVSHYWKSILFVSVILYLSFAPPSTFKGIPTFENEDKLVHLFLYFVLTSILIFDFRQFAKNNHLSTITFTLICIVFPIILGGAIEILQPIYFAPRTAEWLDWFSDIAGVLLGWLGMSLITPILAKKGY
jgi:VanZ family protein